MRHMANLETIQGTHIRIPYLWAGKVEKFSNHALYSQSITTAIGPSI